MRVRVAALCVLSVLAAFAVARWTSPTPEPADPGSADRFREALQERDPLARSYELAASLQQLGPDDLPAALDALESHSIGVTPEEVRLLMLAWTRFDAPAAFAWARDWPTPWRMTLMGEALFAWGYRDGPAALAALEGLEDSRLLERFRSTVVEGWLQSDDRLRAGAFIASLDEPGRRRRLTFFLAGQVMRDGPDAVMRWIESVPEDAPNDFKQGAFYHGTVAIATSDPGRAAVWYEAHRARPYSEGSLEGIARKWAEHHDPPALFDWLRGLPTDGERAAEPGDAIAAGFRIWLRRDPEAAEAWLEAGLPDPQLDPAIGELVRARAESSPAVAVAWAERIEDDTLRRRRMLRAGRSWWRQDPESASAWLAQGHLPETMQQSIRRGATVARGRPAAAAPATGMQ